MHLRKRVLVTGGSGFLVSHLCERLLQAGREELSVDKFFTGSQHNIAHLRPGPPAKVISYDITRPLDIKGDETSCPALVANVNSTFQNIKSLSQPNINILQELTKHFSASMTPSSTITIQKIGIFCK